jgi:hypothetical protein
MMVVHLQDEDERETYTWETRVKMTALVLGAELTVPAAPNPACAMVTGNIGKTTVGEADFFRSADA